MFGWNTGKDTVFIEILIYQSSNKTENFDVETYSYVGQIVIKTDL